MRSPRTLHHELVVAIAILVVATALATAPDAYIPMLARAFMVQWAVVFVIMAGITLLRRRWWVFFGAVVAVCMVAPQVRSPQVGTTLAGSGPTLRIAHMNVWQPNIQRKDAVESALRSGADLISFQEVDLAWAEALSSGLRSTYPYQHVEPRTNCYGIALFSKVPFSAVRTFNVQGSPFVEALLMVEGHQVRVLAVHATSPTSYDHFRKRNLQLDGLALNVAAMDTPTVVIGDLNTVHWDRAYSRFCARSGLSPTVRTDQRTWPSIGPFALIPLDHLLVTPGVAAIAVNTFDIPGSDHRGLLAEMRITGHAP